MITKIAFSNMKYYKSKNIIIGAAIFLTTLLLFLLPTIGVNMIEGQFAAVNEFYPPWHALYRDVDSETVKKLSVYHDISLYGLRSDVGYGYGFEPAKISMIYLDEAGCSLINLKLDAGKLPVAENEIVVSRGFLNELGISAELGDTITLPYQVYRDGGLDYAQEGSFVISGFMNVQDTDAEAENRMYVALVSKAFLEKEVPSEQIQYRFLFQVGANQNAYYDEVVGSINDIARQFGIDERNININEDYLYANYVDPALIIGIGTIMLIVVLAGIITIYSVYYVGMSSKVQELGKLRAVGATKRQIRQIVLREGFCTALIAVPTGLIFGTLIGKTGFKLFLKLFAESFSVSIVLWLYDEGKLSFYHWWVYLLAAAVAFLTVYISLLRPMKKAAKVSETEALRYNDTRVTLKNKKRRSKKDISVAALSKIYLTGNKKNSLITIISMGATGLFIMVVSTVIACTTPIDSANNDVFGQYALRLRYELGNREHPEREWHNIIHNNPMNDELIRALEAIEGVESVSVFNSVIGWNDEFEEGDLQIYGMPQEFADKLKNGIVEGTAEYEELKSGDKVILNSIYLFWYPDLKIGDRITFFIDDGVESYEREVEIIAVGDYEPSFTNYAAFIMAEEGVEKICGFNTRTNISVFANSTYSENTENSIRELIASSEIIALNTWQAAFDEWSNALAFISGAFYIFLIILSVICLMNMVNTMINSVHTRKKEIGMLQAIGMTDIQLVRMLQYEGLFYTLGTIVLSVGVGSALAYPIFLWAKHEHILNIQNYHYPATAAIVIAVVLLAVQMLMAFALGRSVKKESLIERIRFSE